MLAFWIVVLLVGVVSVLVVAPTILSSRISQADPFEEEA